MSGGEKARKLVDLSNFSIYFDSELLGDLEGQALVVRKINQSIYHTSFFANKSSKLLLFGIASEILLYVYFFSFSSRMPCC